MNFNHWWQHHTLSKERNIAQLGRNPVKVVAEIAFKAGYLQAEASQQTVQADALGHADGCAWNHHEVVNGKSYCKRCKHRLT